MKNMNILPLFKYRFKDTFKGSLVYLAVLSLLIFGFLGISFSSISINSTFSGYTFGAFIVLFIFGICSIREDLRLGIQHGVSRRTTFTAEILSSASIALILAVAGEILTLLSQLLAANNNHIRIIDLYQIFYIGYDSEIMNFTQHLSSIAFCFLLVLLANVVGIFMSLLFYRLNKFWTIVVGAGLPILLFVVTPILGVRFELPFFTAAARFIVKIFSNPAGAITSFIIIIVVFTLINWLLLRHVAIEAAKK